MKLRTMFYAAMTCLTFMAQAFAGDINQPAVTAITKAITAPVATCTASGCSGLYLGGEFSGAGAGVNLLNLGSLTSNGTFMGVTGGYQWFNGTYWFGAKVMVDYQIASSSGSLAPSMANLFAFEGAEFGGYLSSLFNLTPITGLPGFMQNAVPTVVIGACQHGSLNGYCSGAAAHFFVPNSKWTVDALYLNAQYGTTSIAPGATTTTENRGTFGVSYHF